MSLLGEYLTARRDEDLARVRRVLALRALLASGWSQREIADSVGISQPAVSQQLRSRVVLETLHPAALFEAAKPVLKVLAGERGYRRLAAFGSIARGEARADSDIDMVVDPPAGTSSFEFVGFKHLIEEVLGREIDLITYGGLTPGTDDDIRRDAVPL